MTFVRGSQGAYSAGNLFLFPWLKRRGPAGSVVWPSVMPIDATQFVQASPIPNKNLPLGDYFCHFVLKAPSSNFIGFELDTPFGQGRSRLAWVTNLDSSRMALRWVSTGPVPISTLSGLAATAAFRTPIPATVAPGARSLSMD
jgi:hypothetical protein